MVDKTRQVFSIKTLIIQKQLSNRVPNRMIVFANENQFLKKNKIIVTSNETKVLNNLKKDEILAYFNSRSF